MLNSLSIAGDGDNVARLVPSDSGFCSVLQADSDVTDRFWEGVMALHDKPMKVLDQMFEHVYGVPLYTLSCILQRPSTISITLACVPPLSPHP